MSAPERADTDRAKPAPKLLVAACGIAAFLLYAWTASPFVLNEDVAEFQALSATHGISHAGYPGYLLLLELAHALPFSTAAYRANLVSVLCGAVAVAMAALACFRLTRSRVASVTSAAALALSYSLWSDATRAEVYAYTLAVSSVAFCACLAYVERPRARTLLVSTVLSGCALTGHLVSLALAGVVAWTVARHVMRGLSPRSHLALALGGVVLGLLPLALIPLRDTPQTAMNYIAYSFDEFATGSIAWAPDFGTRLRRAGLLLSGSQYLEGGWFHPFWNTFERLRFLAWYLLFNDLHLVGSALAFTGLAASVREREPWHRGLLMWFGLVVLLVLLAAFPMVLSSFFLPGLWILCVWLGVGLVRFAGRSRLLAGIALFSIVAFPFMRLRMNAPPPSLARPSIAAAWAAWPETWSPFRPDVSWDTFGRGVLAKLPPNADLIVCWDEGTTLRYLQLAEGLRTDVTVHMACDAPQRIAHVHTAASAEGRAVYTTITIERLAEPRAWSEVGRWPRGTLATYVGSPPRAK